VHLFLRDPTSRVRRVKSLRAPTARARQSIALARI